ncbi:phosphodiesterase [Jiella marina]|uniref:phosphodiesterase n=1 Tax=Jiella sp. LLJ827 TaxID=2917712 RepID=UPI002101C1CB|nr:phosphodiesterase [Jiella sp. LLJ827]MCQ0986293.1 phosphodiesterase [Jiella sp. LLJ827]
MKLIQITDLHLVTPGETLFGLDPLARLEACLADVERHHADADAIVISGDLTHDGEPAAYEALAERIAELTSPVHLMLGNHDRRDTFRAVFGERMFEEGFVQKSVDLADGMLVLLDTLKEGAVEGELCEARLAWLETQLEGAGEKGAYVFAHHPPFRLHMPALDGVRLGNSEAFAQIAREAGNVRHIFAGHVHRPVSGNWRGLSFSALRGTNQQTALVFEDRFVTSHEPPAYAVIFADSAGVVVHFHDFLDQSAEAFASS